MSDTGGGPNGMWDRVRPREPFVELPSLGFPSPSEIREQREMALRARARGRGLAVGRAVGLRSLTWQQWGSHLTGDDVERALRAARYLIYIVHRREELILLRAVQEGWGWDAIGAVLGVSRQAVAQRWARLSARTTDDEGDRGSRPPMNTAPATRNAR